MFRLVWFFEGNVGAGPNQGPAYRLDTDYEFVRVWSHSGLTGDGNLTYDINADGVSLLSGDAVLTDQGTEEVGNVNASAVVLSEGKVITLDIEGAGSRSDVTIQLDLEEL